MDDEQDEQAIEVTSTRLVDFYGDQIPAAQGTDAEIYVPINPLASFLGLNRQGQQQRIQRDPVLSQRTRTLRMDTGGGPQKLTCLPLDLLPGWLFGIDTSRVKPELVDKLNRYRAECFKVLWNAFKSDIMPTLAPPTNLTPAEQILAQAEAIAALARQQVEIERQQIAMATFMRPFVQATRHELADHDQRITALELRLDPQSQITEEQASEIALAVKNVAYALGGQWYEEIDRRK